jgi:hypothetical protein
VAESRDRMKELDDRWDEALKTSSPAIVRSYYFNITKMSQLVLMYGMVSVCLSYGVEPEYVMDYIEDEPMVKALAAERGIDLVQALDKSEWAEYQKFVLETFKDVIEQDKLEREEVQQYPTFAQTWKTDKLDA